VSITFLIKYDIFVTSVTMPAKRRLPRRLANAAPQAILSRQTSIDLVNAAESRRSTPNPESKLMSMAGKSVVAIWPGKSAIQHVTVWRRAPSSSAQRTSAKSRAALVTGLSVSRSRLRTDVAY
jgi:hypothetical protein